MGQVPWPVLVTRAHLGGPLQSFTADAAAGLPGPGWLADRRVAAFEHFADSPMPSEKEEIWRYTPIDRLDLADYRPLPADQGRGVGAGARAVLDDLLAAVGPVSAAVVLRGGVPVALERRSLPDGVQLGGLAGGGPERVDLDHLALGDLVSADDALVSLNQAFSPDVLTLDVPRRVVVEDPVVLVQWVDEAEGAPPAPAVFPRTQVRLGPEARLGLVEVLAGGSGSALVVPVTELSAGDGADLSYVSLQVLGSGAWHIGRLAAQAGRDANLRTFTVGLGGAYDRLRTDAAIVGTGGTSQLRTAYLGTADQVHDVRTVQDHEAPRTQSDLLCKGAVAGTSHSVYSGLIRIRHGAVRSDAMQSNHNLVLDQAAHADSVPNLDIEENDVRCSHASTVGPIDEDQRYYLESRGIPPERAEGLIVQGFFDDILRRAPVGRAVEYLRRQVGVRLADVLEERRHG